MNTELYMEGVSLDLTTDVDALMTYAIDDIRKLGSRNTAYSKTITLPGTARNNRAFGNAFALQGYTPNNEAQPNVGYNFSPSRSADALLTVGRVQIFKGVLRLLGVNVTNGVPEYEVSLFGELGGLWAAIAGLALDDATMGWQTVAATWDAATITGSWSAPSAGEGLYYPLIDYGSVSTDKKHFDLQAFRPAIYVRETLRRLAAAAGYTISGGFLASSFFKSLIIPNTQRDFAVPRSGLLNVSRTNKYNWVEQPQTGSGMPSGVAYQLAFDKLNIVRGFIPANPSSSPYGFTEFKYNGLNTARGLLEAFIPVNLQKFNGAGNITVRFRLMKGGAVVKEQVINYTGANGPGGNFLLDWTGNNGVLVDMAVNDVVAITAEILTNQLFSYIVAANGPSLSFQTTAPALVPALLGDSFTALEAVPAGFQQRDFLAAILKMFNLYVVEDRDVRKKLIITPYPDFYTDTYQDWSGKIDRAGSWTITPMTEAAAKLNYFNYDTDSDYYTDLYNKRYQAAYGSRLYRFNNEFARDKDEVKLPFAGAPLLSYPQKDKRFTTLLKYNGSAEERTSTKPRILIAAHIENVAAWSIRFVGYSVVSRTDYGYAGHLDHPTAPTVDLNFGAPKEVFFDLPAGVQYPSSNLFNQYWARYMAEINDKDAVLWSVPVRLTTLDLHHLNFSVPILVDGILYRLNKVIDYDPTAGGTTRVELLKIIQKA